MSTIASPRPSTTVSSLTTPTSSRRPSLDNPTTSASSNNAQSSTQPQLQSQSQSQSQPQPHPPNLPAKKDPRAALRSYYGLTRANTSPAGQASASSSTRPTAPGSVKKGEGHGGFHHDGDGEVENGAEGEGDGEEGEDGRGVLDTEGLDAEDFVQRLLREEDLFGLMKGVGRLGDEIRALDGERKALVYDNYSKLIAATETIRKMRANMDPLGSTTATLSPAIAHIAATAETVVKTLREREQREREQCQQGPTQEEQGDLGARQRRQRLLVRRVLDAPRRIRKMVRDGRRQEAQTEWAEVVRLLDRWEGVDGVEHVRREGERALKEA